MDEWTRHAWRAGHPLIIHQLLEKNENTLGTSSQFSFLHLDHVESKILFEGQIKEIGVQHVDKLYDNA